MAGDTIKKNITLIIVLILFFSLLQIHPAISDTFDFQTDWIIEGDKVYVNDSNVYLSAEPHTIYEDGWVVFEVMRKTGPAQMDIDLGWGFDTEEAKPTNPQYWNGTAWIDIPPELFTHIDYDYQNMTDWWLILDFTSNKNQLYKARTWIEIPWGGNGGKYWWVTKPSSETIPEAIANGHFYKLDPWYKPMGDWQYDGDKVYVNNSDAYLSAEPHTLYADGYVIFEAMRKTGTQQMDIDFCWGFNTTETQPSTPQYWTNYTHTLTGYHKVEKWGHVKIYNVIEGTSLGIENYDNYSVTYGNTNNTQLYRINYTGDNGPVSIIIAFTSYDQDGSTYTFYGNDDIWELYEYQETFWDWWNIPANRFIHLNYDFQNMTDWWIVKNFTTNKDQMYKARAYVNTLFDGFNRSYSKYWWAVKPTDMTIQEAIQNEVFYRLDPWMDTQWDYRKKVTTNSSMVPNNVEDFPFLLHISSDSDLANDSKCQNQGQDIVFATLNDVRLDHEIEYFNGDTGELIAWIESNLSSGTDTEVYMYYGNSNASHQHNPSATWNTNYTGVWHLSEETEFHEFDTSRAYDPDVIHISGDIYAIGYEGVADDGFIQTHKIMKGNISSAIDSLEFDESDCAEPDMIHITNNVFAIVYQGTDGDGFLKTVEILSNGSITGVIDTLEFDTARGKYPDIIHVYGSIYAIAYSGVGNDGFIVTVNISNNGSIADSIVDSFEYDTSLGEYPELINISNNIFASAYQGAGNGGFVATIWIDNNGSINNTVLDTLEFETVRCLTPDIIQVSDDIYAITYDGEGNDGWMVTINISDNGSIVDSVIDSFEWDTGDAGEATIEHVIDDIYVIAYAKLDISARDGYMVTLDIASNGTIGSIKDNFEFDTERCREPKILRLHGATFPPIQFIIAYRENANDGWMRTIAVASDGTIFDLYEDSSGNDNYGLGGNGVSAQMPSRVDAIVYKGQDFDGVDDYIFIADDTSLQLGNKGMVSVWFKLDNLHNDSDNIKRLIGKNNNAGTNGSYLLELDDNGKFRGRLYDGSYHTATSTQDSWNAGAWYYVTMTWNTTSGGYGIKLYVNASQDGSNSDNNYVPYTAGDVRVGLFRNDDKDPYEGVMDEAHISNVDRNSSWITTSFNTVAYQGVGNGKFIKSVGNEEQETQASISISPSSVDFGTVTIDSYNLTTDYYFNLTNDGGVTINVSISVGNSQNWTFINYSDIGHDKFAMNWSDDNWTSESNIKVGGSILKSNLASNNYYLFDLKIFTPLTISKIGNGESIVVTLTATAV